VSEKLMATTFPRCPSQSNHALINDEAFILERDDLPLEGWTGLRSEEAELLFAGVLLSLALDLDDVEADGLGEGFALANSDDVTLLDSGESGGAVSGEVLVSLLESVVLGDVVEVISSDDDGSSHLGRSDNTPIHIIINIY
jgi:hypothetical protein